MGDEDRKVVKLTEVNRVVKDLSKINYALVKKNVLLQKQINVLQKERDAAVIGLNRSDLLFDAKTNEKSNTIAELQEELRRCETSRRDTKRTMSNLILNTIICLDKGLPKAQRDDVIMKLSQFGDIGYRARAKFEIVLEHQPEEQSVEEKKLIADAAEAVEEVDADELEAAAKENTDDAGK